MVLSKGKIFRNSSSQIIAAIPIAALIHENQKKVSKSFRNLWPCLPFTVLLIFSKSTCTGQIREKETF